MVVVQLRGAGHAKKQAKGLIEPHDEDASQLERQGALRTALEKGALGAAVGLGGRFALLAAPELLRAALGRPRGRPPLTEWARDAGRHALFLASLLGGYQACLCGTRRVAPASRPRSAALAGALSGLALLWLPRDRRGAVALFALARALELQAKLVAQWGWVPSLVHGDTALLALSSGSMVHSYVFHPHSIDRSYLSFIDRASQIPPAVKSNLGRAQLGLPLELEALNKARAHIGARQLVDPLGYDQWPGGELLHPRRGLATHMVVFFCKMMKIAVPMHVAVFALPALARPRQAVARPGETAARVGLGVLRSSVFVSVFCTSAFSLASALRSLGFTYSNLGSGAQAIFGLAAALSSSSAFIEHKSRRLEVALFVFAKALEAKWNQVCRGREGSWPWRSVQLLAFLYSVSTFAYVHSAAPELVRASYRSFGERAFGSSSSFDTKA